MSGVGSEGAQVTATRVGRCLIVTVPAELDPQVFGEVRDRTLHALQQGGVGAVVLEVSMVEIMDLEDFDRLLKLASMARLLGVRPMVVGLRAGVVMHLVSSDVDTDGLETVRDLQEALDRVSREGEGEPTAEAAVPADDAPLDTDQPGVWS